MIDEACLWVGRVVLAVGLTIGTIGIASHVLFKALDWLGCKLWDVESLARAWIMCRNNSILRPKGVTSTFIPKKRPPHLPLVEDEDA